MRVLLCLAGIALSGCASVSASMVEDDCPSYLNSCKVKFRRIIPPRISEDKPVI